MAEWLVRRSPPYLWDLHGDVIEWIHFPRYWPFVRWFHRWPVNSPHKGQWRGALLFPLICAGMNGWVNTRKAGDLRRHRAHYYVIVMRSLAFGTTHCHHMNRFAHDWHLACCQCTGTCSHVSPIHDDVIKWKHFPRYWPFVRGIHRYPVNSKHKGQWRGALMFSLISACVNTWVNNREAGDLRRHRGHYDVIVMI